MAAATALITALLAGYTTSRLERRKWLTGLKSTLALELQKARLASYPAVFQTLGKLSSRAKIPLSRDSAGEVADELNAWMYSAGGMSAEASTRGAILLLRELLLQWSRDDILDRDTFYLVRNRTFLLLRRDLDVIGLETYDPESMTQLLEQVREASDVIIAKRKKSSRSRVS